MKFDQFEDGIDAVILERGREYWQDGAVVKLWLWRSGQWRAQVQGSELYHVAVRRSKGQLKESSCSCLYDRGVCKHVVAVLFAIRDGSWGTGIAGPVRDEEKLIKDYLNILSASDLGKLVWEAAYLSDDFFNALTVKAQKLMGGGDKREYRRILRRSLVAAQDRHGYIGYWQSCDAVRGADELLAQAEELESMRPRESALIYETIIETMVPVLNYADDSNGDIGSVIEAAAEHLDALVDRIEGQSLKDELYSYLIKEAVKKQYEDWDWCWSMLETASKLAQKNNRDEFFVVVDKFAERDRGFDFSNEYARENAAKIKLNVIVRLGSAKEAEGFMDRFLHYHHIRDLALEYYWNKEDLNKCMKLAREGVEQANGRWPGLVVGYQEWILKIARARGDKQEVRRLEIDLFLQTHDFTYLSRLRKSTKSDKEWQELRKGIIRKLIKGNLRNKLVLAQLYDREEMLPQLHSLVVNDAHLMRQYADKLVRDYKADVIKAYVELITQGIEHASGRGMYQEKCELLKELKSLGGVGDAQRLKNNLMKMYPNRPAMLDELSRVRL